MALSRRDLLVRALFATPGVVLGPQVFLRAAFGATSSGPRNLILIELQGGNDGINTIIPYGLDGGTYYSIFRPTIGVPEGSILKIDSQLGFHPNLFSLKSHYDAGRLAVIQGCSYPNPNFSHDVASGIFDTGIPSSPYSAGWVARWIASQAPASFPLGIETGSSHADGVLAGSGTLVPSIHSISEFALPSDSKYSTDKNNRRTAYQAIAQGLAPSAGTTGAIAGTTLDVLSLMDVFKTIPKYTTSVTYPGGSFGKALKLVAQLLKANLGARYFHLSYGGFDTHSDQNSNNYHGAKLQVVSDGIDALYVDLTSLGLMDDSLIVVYTEFGRTVYENGSGGTDHGTITPIFVLGNSVSGGLVTPHPSMNPANLTSHKQPPMTTDFRDVWCTILTRWLNGDASSIFPSYSYNNLGFLP
jgi:uncharacterized protein (DUF1501 family)